MFKIGKERGFYHALKTIDYYSERYDKAITVPWGYPSDGATWALDVCRKGWLLHDFLCDNGNFDDGTKCSNWQASVILHDVLWNDCHRYIRSVTWFLATFLLGGGEARKNGMFRVQEV